MQINQALDIAKAIDRARKIAGPYVQYPYTQDQMADVIVFLADTYVSLLLTNKEEVTKARRQTAAAEARYKRLEKRTNISVDPVTDDQLEVV